MRALLYREEDGRKPFHIRLEATSRFIHKKPTYAFIIFKREIAKLQKLGYHPYWITNQRPDEKRIAYHHGKLLPKKNIKLTQKYVKEIADGINEVMKMKID